MPSKSEWTRVIVLTPPPAEGGGLGAQLKSLFASRDWFAVEQSDPYLAMAELCLREKAQAARSAWGLQRMERLALVVQMPEYWPRLDDLISAVRRYVPNATIWTATETDVMPLEELVEAGAAAVAAPALQAKRSSHNSENRVTHQHAGSNKIADTDAQRLTRDEIDMLLHGDADEVES